MPTWSPNGSQSLSKIHGKTMQRIITKSEAKMEPPKNISPKGPWAWSARRGKEVRSSSGDSRSRFPLASNILKTANTWQTIKKRANIQEPLAPPRTHLTCRQARCGSNIYWAHGSPGSSDARPQGEGASSSWSPHRLILDSIIIFVTKNILLDNKVTYPKQIIDLL